MNPQLPLDLPGPRVSRITVARLYSTDRYEHARYEVTVELPPGTSPTSVLSRLDTLMAELNPKPPHSESEVLRCHAELKKPHPEPPPSQEVKDAHALNDDAIFDPSPQERYDRTMELRERCREIIRDYNDWREERDAALAAFDEFGGTRQFGGLDSEE